ncbi:MAG: endolytic transglycosylase MltG [Tepidiformaceae bacterium]
MRLRAIPWTVAVALGLVPVALLVASYCIAGTPAAVLDGRIVALQPPPATGAPVAYTLAEGRSAGEIGADLERKGVIRSGRQFQVLVSLMGLQQRLSAGDYVLNSGSSALSVIDAITVRASGPVLRVTFPEGIRLEEMATIAEKSGFGTANDFLEAVAGASLPADFAASLPLGASLQGYLFPDTYFLPVGSDAVDLVAEMIKTLDSRFAPPLKAAVRARGLTLHQALTLASIVEREAAIAAERPIMAGVFYNRLDEGDLLGADPTVQFAVALDPASVARFGYWKKELTIDDLQHASPYNTRRFAGLPPGPITNPGLASIEAAARPTETKFYYFVANAKAADGSHVFAETEAGHLRNQAEFGAP